MDKIVTPQKAIEIANDLKKNNKKIVLGGGAFDILHQGHIAFINKAKEQGNVLFIFLESDEKIQKIKGENRPLHSQKKRASILSSIPSINYIILLPYFENNEDYDTLVSKIKPDIIVSTKNDKNIIHKRRQANSIGAKVVEVIDLIPDISTTIIEKNIS